MWVLEQGSGQETSQSGGLEAGQRTSERSREGEARLSSCSSFTSGVSKCKQEEGREGGREGQRAPRRSPVGLSLSTCVSSLACPPCHDLLHFPIMSAVLHFLDRVNI